VIPSFGGLHQLQLIFNPGDCIWEYMDQPVEHGTLASHIKN
jgi:hypothetical protein